MRLRGTDAKKRNILSTLLIMTVRINITHSSSPQRTHKNNSYPHNHARLIPLPTHHPQTTLLPPPLRLRNLKLPTNRRANLPRRTRRPRTRPRPTLLRDRTPRILALLRRHGARNVLDHDPLVRLLLAAHKLLREVAAVDCLRGAVHGLGDDVDFGADDEERVDEVGCWVAQLVLQEISGVGG